MSSTNIFNRHSQTQNIFGGQQPSNNLFKNQNTSNTSGNISINSQQRGTNNLFSQNHQQTSMNLISRGGTYTGNAFNQDPQYNRLTTNLFNQGGTTLFSHPTSNTSGGLFNNNSTNQSKYNTNVNKYPFNPNCPVNQSKIYQILQAPAEQQKRMFENLQIDYLKQAILYYSKSIDILKSQKFQLPTDNPLRNEKILKISSQLNIKPQIVHIKRLIGDNLTGKLKNLKQSKQRLDIHSRNFSVDVFQKLQKYKQKLLVSVTQNKMMEQIKKELDEIELQVKDFFTPLFNAQQTRTYIQFIDPNPFCIHLSEKLLKNMSMLQNRVDEILACDGQNTEENIDSGDVIMQLVEYYQNVAVALKDYSMKYNELKRRAMQHSGQRSPQQAFKKLTEKATSIMRKEMEGYQLVKEIESLLQKREKTLSSKKQ